MSMQTYMLVADALARFPQSSCALPFHRFASADIGSAARVTSPVVPPVHHLAPSARK